MTKKIWTVQLDSNHVPYRFVEFKRSREHVDDYTVVIVDVEKLMTCFERDSLAIPRPEEWEKETLIGIREFLNPKGGACDMPAIGFSLQPVKHCWLRRIIDYRVETVPVVGFINGRHRARYIQYAGASTMPVEIRESDASLLREHCGSDL